MAELTNFWEFEWYKALHLLRDGTQLAPDRAFERGTLREAEARLQWWKKASSKEILGDMLRLDPPPFSELATTDERAKAKREWIERERAWLKKLAEWEREGEIASLERQLNPKKIHALEERRAIWHALIRARTIPAVQEACRRWENLADVRAIGFACFAAHVSTSMKEFLRMKRNRRFPRSKYADDSRLEYLARGMAGVMMGISAATAIDRLRKMKHAPGGSLWNEAEKRCECWRCENKRWSSYFQRLGKHLGEQIEKHIEKGARK